MKKSHIRQMYGKRFHLFKPMFLCYTKNTYERTAARRPLMFRPFSIKDLDAIMQIWLEGNLDAHPFIPPDYWLSREDLVRSLLPRAQEFL